MQIFLVGGAVRDRLLGLAVKDRDYVVVGASSTDMLRQGYRQVGQEFPVFLHPNTGEEYALARTERKAGQGHKGFRFSFGVEVSLEDDLIRRDLTINAMAQDDAGQIIDPYGGQQDLEQKILRHVSSAFVEDPLRVLRLMRFWARFAPLGFQIAPETLDLCRQMVASGELNELTAERVWQETAKALSYPRPSCFFTGLAQVGALEMVSFTAISSEQLKQMNADLSAAVERTENSALRLALWTQHNFAVITAMKAHLPLPKNYIQWLDWVRDCAVLMRDWGNVSAETRWEMLKKCGGLRGQGMVLELARGLGLTKEMQTRITQSQTRANEITVDSVIADGFHGVELGVEIKRRQIKQLSDF